MKKFTIYDESTAAPASDHTDFQPNTLKQAIGLNWLPILAIVLLFAVCIWVVLVKNSEPDRIEMRTDKNK